MREDNITGLLIPTVELQSKDSRAAGDMYIDEEPLTEGDVIIDFASLHFGMKAEDPLKHVPFCGKENPNVQFAFPSGLTNQGTCHRNAFRK